MKKWLITLLFFPILSVAQDVKEPIFREYIIQENNLNKCLFPEIYRSSDRGQTILNQWWEDADNGRMKRAYYLKLKIRLAQRIMPSAMAQQFLGGSLSSQFEQAQKRYLKKTSIKSLKECQKVRIFATNLIEEYDEFNEKWWKEFPKP